ncbi:MAG: hypothetical protein IT385_15005 [Deltaproteobacteria bacterium]|nr:hypothetical protein [Deltaproteobacteria bacterium]
MSELAGWEAALAAYAPVLDHVWPPRWRLSTPRGRRIDVRLDTHAPGFALDVEAELHDPWTGLVIMPRALALGAQHAHTPLVTGDAAFDATALVFDTTETHRGVFDHATRRATITLLERGGLVMGGAVRLPPAATAELDAEDARAAMGAFVTLLDRLTTLTARDAGGAVIEIAERDPDPDVRIRYAAWAGTREIKRQGATSELDRLRFGPLDVERLLAMCRDRTLAPAARSTALDILLRRAPPERATELEPPVLWDLEISEATLLAALREHRGRPEAMHALGSVTRDLAGAALGAPTTFTRELLDALDAARPDERAWLERMVWAHHDAGVRERAASHLLAGADTAQLLALIDAAPRSWLVTSPQLGLDVVARLVREPAHHERALPIVAELARHALPGIASRALGLLFDLRVPPERIMGALGVAHTALLLQRGPSLARDRGREALPLARALFDRVSATGSTAEALIDWLDLMGALGDADDVPRLTPHLAHAEPPVVLATLGALAAIGDLAAVSAIRPLTSGLFRNRDVKARARETLEAITERAGDRAGALSVSEDAGGRLEVADD